LGEATRQFKKIHHDRVGSMDGLGLPMTVAVSEDAQRSVFLVNTLDLVGDDGRGFIPADAHVLTLAPVLRVALSFGIPVHALQGILDAVRWIDPLLIGDLVGRKKAFQRRLVLDAVFVQFVLPQLFFRVPLSVVMGADPDDLPILDVHWGDLAPLGKRALSEGFQNGLVFDPQIAPTLIHGPHRGPPLKMLLPNLNVAGEIFLWLLGPLHPY
jgi:hypothetical protein